MLLVHKPSGKAVVIAKRLAGPWYCISAMHSIDEFFEYCDGDGHSDDYVLVREDQKGWDYEWADPDGWDHAYDRFRVVFKEE
jgi:hypothetical protein